MPYSIPATDVGCAAADSVFEPQHNEIAVTLALIEEWSKKHPQSQPVRNAACPEENRVANLISKLRMRCTQSLGPAPSQQQLSVAEVQAFSTLLSSFESEAPAQPAHSSSEASMPRSTPALGVVRAAADSIHEAQQNEWIDAYHELGRLDIVVASLEASGSQVPLSLDIHGADAALETTCIPAHDTGEHWIDPKIMLILPNAFPNEPSITP